MNMKQWYAARSLVEWATGEKYEDEVMFMYCIDSPWEWAKYAIRYHINHEC